MDTDILDGFVTETFDLLDEIEPQLIELSDQSTTRCASAETLNAVFRLFHTMKGGAGFLGLSTIGGVTHEAETLLDLFRKGQGALSDAHVQTLCETIDFIRILLNTVAESGADAGHDQDAEGIKDRLIALASEALAAGPARATQGFTGALPDEVRSADMAASQPGSEADRPLEQAAPHADPVADAAASQPEAGRAQEQARPDAGGEADAGADPSGPALTPALRASYAQEAEDALDQAELALLALEGEAGPEGRAEHFGSAFRALHSLKGNSGFMGFADMEALAHRMETALELLRDGMIAVRPDINSLLLKVLDVLRATVGEIAGGGQGAIQGRDIYLDLLNDTMPGLRDALSRNEISTAAPEPVRTAAPLPPPPSNQAPEEPKTKITRHTKDTAKAPPRKTSPPASSGPSGPSIPPSPTTAQPQRQDIRVDIQKLDALVNLVGELVIAESMVTRHPHVAGAEIESLERATHLLRRVSRDLQDVVMSARMIPLAGTFRKMIRLVHDLAGKSGKQIALKLVGEATEVDKTVIEQIGDPLVHIIRNAADHGIEGPEQRRESGKDEQATITIEGRHEGGEVWVLISDDGRGLNRERILTKARENGLVGEEADEWPDERIYRLIFEPGFSTAERVTDVSGRGVGMDVVRKNIEKLKGRIDIRSNPDQGSTFILRIPLTLAIIEGMMVRVGQARYTIPLLAIRESVQPEPSWISTTPDGQESVRIRDDFYPILRLHHRFNKHPDHAEFHKGILVLVECDRRTIALFVDEILGRQETVIKGLSDYLGHSPGVSGCTILGDGEVSLILDVAGLVEERGGG